MPRSGRCADSAYLPRPSTKSKPMACRCFIARQAKPMRPSFSCCTDFPRHLSCSASSFRAWPIDYRVIAPIFRASDSPRCRLNENIRTPLINWRLTIDAFTQALKLDRYAIYVFDYGAPTGFRLAMAHPERVTAIVSQNGNAYEEGLGDAWGPIQKYWAAPYAGEPGHTPPECFDGRRNALAVHRTA